MKQQDIDKVIHYRDELKKLQATERLFADGPKFLEIRFPGDAGDGPMYRLDASDSQYQSVVTLARLQNKMDIEEARDTLRQLGVTPE